MVYEFDSDGVSLALDVGVSGAEVSFELVSVDEGVDDVSVGVDGGGSDGSVFGFLGFGFGVGLCSALNGGVEGRVDVVDFEGDVSDEVSVLAEHLGVGMVCG